MARSSCSSAASDLPCGSDFGRQRRSPHVMTHITGFSRSHTAGQMLRANQLISGDRRRHTHSLLRSENTFGISSPQMMVTTVSGTTTSAMASTSARPRETPRRRRMGKICSFAPAPPVAAAIAPQSVTPSCTTARLRSMPRFMRSEALDPARFSRESASSRATETEARAIS